MKSTNESAGRGPGMVLNNENVPSKADRKAKFPRMPMVRHGREWFRARILKDDERRIFVEFTGFEDGSFVKPFWIQKDSDLIFKGSYRGKDWKYLVSAMKNAATVHAAGPPPFRGCCTNLPVASGSCHTNALLPVVVLSHSLLHPSSAPIN